VPQQRGTRLRSTRQAAAVIAAMSAMTAFSDARDIHEAVRQAGGRAGLATVYRHLRVLAEQPSVDTIRGPAGLMPRTWHTVPAASVYDNTPGRY
jgi:Fur family ferric uptake transcriptional regulator